MKKITLRLGWVLVLIVISIIACTKEISDDAISTFELTETHEDEGFLNVSVATTIHITGADNLVASDYQWKYEVNRGSGFFTFTNEIVTEGVFIQPTSSQINIEYTGTTVEKHNVIITVKDKNNKELTIDLIYNIKEGLFTFEIVPATPTVAINESVAINMNVLALGSTTYQTQYAITNRGQDGAGSGIIKVDDKILEPTTFISVDPGDFSWSFEATALGTVELLFTTESSSGVKVVKVINIEVTEASTYTFDVTTTSNEALTDEEVVLLFSITDNEVLSTYTMSFVTSIAGTLFYDGQVYNAGDEIPVTEGLFTANYTGTAIGNHSINFTVLNGNTVPLEQTGSTTITYTESIPTVPIITLNGQNPLTLIVGNDYIEEATARDNIGEDITASIRFGGTFDGTTATVGTFTRTYDVMDADENPAVQKTRTIFVEAVVDETAPDIKLNGDGENVTLNFGDAYTETVTATDNIDGDITANITFGGTFDGTTAAVGTFTRTYDVVDEAGNPAMQKTRTITVEDNILPIIDLKGSSSITIDQGTMYTEIATATDNVDGDITANIDFGGTFDGTTATVGTFTRTYDVSDVAGNAAEQMIRTITVVQVTSFNNSTGLLTGTPGATVTVGMSSQGDPSSSFSAFLDVRTESATTSTLLLGLNTMGSASDSGTFTLPATGKAYFTGLHTGNRSGTSSTIDLSGASFTYTMPFGL